MRALWTLVGLIAMLSVWMPTAFYQTTAATTRSTTTAQANATIAARLGHTCAITNSGGVKCWGRNDWGQLGDGTTIDRLTPVDVIGLSSGVTALGAGEGYTCALTSSGGVKCWGLNGGQLGDGTTTDRLTPMDVSGLSSGVTVLAVGVYHTCALTSSGGVKCWGANDEGQFGDGTTTERLTPVDVSGLSSGVTALATGLDYTCAITSSGGVKCWGSNYGGKLGDGTTTRRLTPVDVSGLSSGVTALAAGYYHTCAVTSSGGVKCWGGNGSGQLGDGTTTNRLTPVEVSGLSSGVTAVAAGGNYTCALTSSGGVKCWGYNGSGQLGEGTQIDRLTPVDVQGLSTSVTALAAGTFHACAVTSSGGVKCWGNNGDGQLGDGTKTNRLTPVDVVGITDFVPTPGTPTPGTPTPTEPTPTQPTPIPGNDTPPVPGRPAQTRTAGGVAVYAASFTGDATNWTTNGTVWVGDYTIVDNATLQSSGGALSGSGLVSLLTKADGSQRTTLFQDSFDVSGGTLKPRAANGDWRLKNVVGFTVENPPTEVTLDVKAGKLSTTLNLAVVIPGSKVVKTITLTLSHTGAVNSTFNDFALTLGRIALKVKKATFSADGIAIEQANLQLPPTLGNGQAELDNASITSDGQFHLGKTSASVSINFPNIHVGGDAGFGIEDAKATLEIKDNTYFFHGEGKFVFPGADKEDPEKPGCQIGTSFTFASTPPSVREAGLSIEGCFKFPIGQTGFLLTGLRGKVQLDESNQVAVDLGISIESEEVPKIGPAFSGQPNVHWDSSWKVGLNGTFKIFRLDIGEAALTLSKKEGLSGTIKISFLSVLKGDGSLHIWKDNSRLQVTGSVSVGVKVEQGALHKGRFPVPPFDLPEARGTADFGKFRHGDETVYGLKGNINVRGVQNSVFIDSEGNVRYGQLNEYQLVKPPSVQAANGRPAADVRPFTVAPNTPAIIAGLAVDSGAPTLSLSTPDGQTLTAASAGVVATTTPTQTLLTVPNPAPGAWKINVENLSGGEQYLVAAFGARPAATVSAPTVTANGDGSYTIGLAASSSAPTSTISLFADTSPISRTGQPLVQSLPLTTTSYVWRPANIANGTHYLYAMVDDPQGAPAFAYSATPVMLNDTTPPAVPVGLSVRANGTNALIAWTASAAPDVAGYHITYREPDSGTTFVADVPRGDQTSYTQGGLYLNGGWEVSISAYDLNDNESAKSAATTVQIGTNGLYLPLVTR